MVSVMDKGNEKGSKRSTGDHVVVQNGNGDSQHSRTESGSSSLSSSSFSSASSSFTGFPEADSSNDPNSRSDEPDIARKDSPPVQEMNRNFPDGYDPKRIPTSVTGRSKSTVPAEWSCTSNESLFSIHLGITSFSVYGDLMKSGELFRSGELVSHTPALPLTPPTKIESNQKTADSDKEVVETPKEVQEESQQKTADHPAVSWRSPTTSYRSDKSSNSTNSFSFPM